MCLFLALVVLFALSTCSLICLLLLLITARPSLLSLELLLRQLTAPHSSLSPPPSPPHPPLADPACNYVTGHSFNVDGGIAIGQ